MLSPRLADLDVEGELLFLVQLLCIIKTKLKSTLSALQEISNDPYSLNKPPGWKRKQLLHSQA